MVAIQSGLDLTKTRGDCYKPLNGDEGPGYYLGAMLIFSCSPSIRGSLFSPALFFLLLQVTGAASLDTKQMLKVERVEVEDLVVT